MKQSKTLRSKFKKLKEITKLKLSKLSKDVNILTQDSAKIEESATFFIQTLFVRFIWILEHVKNTEPVKKDIPKNVVTGGIVESVSRVVHTYTKQWI